VRVTAAARLHAAPDIDWQTQREWWRRFAIARRESPGAIPTMRRVDEDGVAAAAVRRHYDGQNGKCMCTQDKQGSDAALRRGATSLLARVDQCHHRRSGTACTRVSANHNAMTSEDVDDDEVSHSVYTRKHCATYRCPWHT
jgi:hypothetical protein